MGATNQARADGGLLVLGGTDRPSTMTVDTEAAHRGPQSARGVPRLSALDRVRESADVPRAMTSRVSTGTRERQTLPHLGISPRSPRRQLVTTCLRIPLHRASAFFAVC